MHPFLAENVEDISHSEQTDESHYYLLVEEQPVDSTVDSEDKAKDHYQPLSESEELENEDVRLDKTNTYYNYECQL